MKIITTVSFDPPASSEPIACYGARIIIGGKEQPSLDNIPATATSFDITAEENDQVVILFAAKNQQGLWSPATPVEFVVSKQVPPARPTNLRVTGAVPPTPADNASRATASLAKQLTSDDTGSYNMTVTGHPEIKDGAVGTIIGIDSSARESVHVIFPAAALKSGVKSDGKSKEYTFDVKENLDIIVLTPSQDAISLADYVRIQTDLLNAATADVT